MALSGVRSSWLMRERNSVFRRDASRLVACHQQFLLPAPLAPLEPDEHHDPAAHDHAQRDRDRQHGGADRVHAAVGLGVRDGREHRPAERVDALADHGHRPAVEVEVADLPVAERRRPPDRLAGDRLQAGRAAPGRGQQHAALVGDPQVHALPGGGAVGQRLHRVELDAHHDDGQRPAGRRPAGARGTHVGGDRHHERMIRLRGDERLGHVAACCTKA
jgi:hypothetical protein